MATGARKLDQCNLLPLGLACLANIQHLQNINEIPPLVISVPVIADVAKYTATLVAAPIAALLAMYPAATTMTGIIRPVGSFTRMGLL